MDKEIGPIQDEILLYQSEDGNVKVDVLFQDETVWLTQEQMALLFGKARSTINEHIQNIYQEGELQEGNSMRKFGNSEFSMKPTNYYNLDVIISVGYRVKSRQGTMFRIWATQRLRDYIIRGYALNEERFKKGSSMNYFRELIEKIREIRLEEKVFYQQIKDIYKTSIDYDPSDEMTIQFFKEVQNKLLWAVSEKTAAASGSNSIRTEVRTDGMELPELEPTQHRFLSLIGSHPHERLDHLSPRCQCAEEISIMTQSGKKVEIAPDYKAQNGISWHINRLKIGNIGGQDVNYTR